MGEARCDDYGCIVDGCNRRFSSKRGRGQHLRHHDDAEKESAILSEICRVADIVGDTPTRREFRDNSTLSAKIVQLTFGTWNSGLCACGLNENHAQLLMDEDEILDEIQRVATALGKTPTKREFKKQAKISDKQVRSCFGTWNKGLREAGFEPNKVPGSYKPGCIYYGPNWKESRSKAVDRDNNRCAVTGTHSDEIENQSVHAHHIKPAREFGAHDPDVETDYDKMNALDNLICLSPSCHRRLEGKFQNASPDEFEQLGKRELNHLDSSVQNAVASD